MLRGSHVKSIGAIATVALGLATIAGCGNGQAWVQQPITPDAQRELSGGYVPAPPPRRLVSRTLGDRSAAGRMTAPDVQGRVLGSFRNTYYDFPSETDFAGGEVAIMSATCTQIVRVPKAFHDAVCVQGSGRLKRGATVSFAKRDCSCAETCPRTGQKICFEELDAKAFPWGRGATGKAITPLRTVAADPSVLPMGTTIYVPELDGLDVGGAAHDGCLLVQDRGSRVVGEHIDIFAGSPDRTAFLNDQLPSNTGVTVVVDTSRCARLAQR
jgi:3D (Asp-Asp-Asp) domain-containing protein